MCPLYRDWISVAVLIADSDSFLLALLGPNYIRAHPVFLSWDGYSKHCRANRQRHPHGGEDNEILLLLWSSFWCSICGFVACCMVIILWKGVGRSTGMNNKMWRWALIGGRCLAVLRWCRDESLRCGATRRITSRTGVISGSANLEKTGPFVVKNTNKWPVFRCTVNWARARPRSTLIASGATGSSSV